MKVTIRGYSTLTGSPEAIVKVLQDANYFESEGIPNESAYMAAEQMLTAMENENIIIIEER